MKKRGVIGAGCSIAVVALLVVFMSSAGIAATGGPTKTIKIGTIAWEGWPMGLELQRGCQVAADVFNKKGGIDINGEKYKLEIVSVDSKFTQEGGRSAAERLVSRDKVKFIIGDETVDAWLSITESNKVLVICQTPNPDVTSSKYKLAFQGSTIPNQYQEFFGWYVKNVPSVKTFVMSYPDNRIGHFTADIADQLSSRFGFKVLDKVFYPPESTDFSTIATKVKAANPDAFAQFAGGPVTDSLVMKTVRLSGFKGQLVCPNPDPTEFIRRAVPLTEIEGMIGPAFAIEQEPMPPVAREFMDVYMAKYPRDYPEPTGGSMLYILATALQKAGSTDPVKVASVLRSGLSYESPVGLGRMISRPERGNNACVDTLVGLSIKRIQGGKASIVHTISPDEAYGYLKKAFGWK